MVTRLHHEPHVPLIVDSFLPVPRPPASGRPDLLESAAGSPELDQVLEHPCQIQNDPGAESGYHLA